MLSLHVINCYALKGQVNFQFTSHKDSARENNHILFSMTLEFIKSEEITKVTSHELPQLGYMDHKSVTKSLRHKPAAQRLKEFSRSGGSNKRQFISCIKESLELN